MSMSSEHPGSHQASRLLVIRMSGQRRLCVKQNAWEEGSGCRPLAEWAPAKGWLLQRWRQVCLVERAHVHAGRDDFADTGKAVIGKRDVHS
jgi:hypothetical protein